MMLNAYSIYDVKALQWHPPFYVSTDAAAARLLADVVHDPNTLIGRHPTDHVLYCVGTFNDASGELQPISPRRHVADAAAFVPLPPAVHMQHREALDQATNGSAL